MDEFMFTKVPTHRLLFHQKLAPSQIGFDNFPKFFESLF